MLLNVVSPFSYTIETLIQAGSHQIAVATVPIETNAATRPSRLFKSNPPTAAGFNASARIILSGMEQHSRHNASFVAESLENKKAEKFSHFGRVWQNILAMLSFCFCRGYPKEIPLATISQGSQGGDGFCIGHVPTATAALEPRGGRLTA